MFVFFQMRSALWDLLNEISPAVQLGLHQKKEGRKRMRRPLRVSWGVQALPPPPPPPLREAVDEGVAHCWGGSCLQGAGLCLGPLLPQMPRVWRRISREARHPSTGNTWCLLLECFCIFVAELDLSPCWMLVCVPDFELSFPLYFNIRDVIKKVSLK